VIMLRFSKEVCWLSYEHEEDVSGLESLEYFCGAIFLAEK
jgi:hypothetical protein